MCVYTRSISAIKYTHVTLAPSFPASPLYNTSQGSQVRRVRLVTAPTQGASWLLHADDADTELAAGVLIPLISLLTSWEAYLGNLCTALTEVSAISSCIALVPLMSPVAPVPVDLLHQHEALLQHSHEVPPIFIINSFVNF